MSNQPRQYRQKRMEKLVPRLRDDLNAQDYVLLYAYNATGKTRLSMLFKDYYKGKPGRQRDTLYFNAYTEDLFTWFNDFENESDRYINLNSESRFFSGLQQLALEERIAKYLERYVKFNFKIDYDEWRIRFYIGDTNNIKISRGEERIFVWCFFLAICEAAIDGAEAYDWVRYLYIDDPISSLDENNAITVACDLADLLKRGRGKVKTVLSTHHSLFYNIMCNEIKPIPRAQYFLHRNVAEEYVLQTTTDTPYFHHVALLVELKLAMEKGQIKTYHFNSLRSVMEKTSSFLGYDKVSDCLHGIEDEVLFERALNLLSHGGYSIFQPVEMTDDNKDLFGKILRGFLEKYPFRLPQLHATTAATTKT